MNNINVVYTPWANLKKTGDMDVGQIGFHRQKEVSGSKWKLKRDEDTEKQAELSFHVSRSSGENRGGGEKDQRDDQPPGEDERWTLPRPGGGEGIERPGGEEREEGSAPGTEETREGGAEEEKRAGGA